MRGFDYLITSSFVIFFGGGGEGAFYIQAQGIVFDTSVYYSCCKMLNSPFFANLVVIRKSYMYFGNFFAMSLSFFWVYFSVDIVVLTRVVSMPQAWGYNIAWLKTYHKGNEI